MFIVTECVSLKDIEDPVRIKKYVRHIQFKESQDIII